MDKKEFDKYARQAMREIVTTNDPRYSDKSKERMRDKLTEKRTNG